MRPAISAAAANAVCPESLHTACESCTRTATPVQRSNTAKSAEILVLIRSGREDQAMMTTLAGLIVVLSIMVKEISVLFVSIKALFDL